MPSQPSDPMTAVDRLAAAELYVPTLADIEAAWLQGFGGDAGAMKRDRLDREAAFDRAIAKVKADALREAASVVDALAHDAETFGQQVVLGHSVDRVQGYDLGVTTAAMHIRHRAARIESEAGESR